MGITHDFEEDLEFENKGNSRAEKSYEENFAGSNYENYKDDIGYGDDEYDDANGSYLEYTPDDDYGSYDRGVYYGGLPNKRKINRKDEAHADVDRISCAKFSGAMQNIEANTELKIKGWSKCSKMKFDAFIGENGGDHFCLYMGQKISQSKCGSSWLGETSKVIHPSSRQDKQGLVKPKGKRRNKRG